MTQTIDCRVTIDTDALPQPLASATPSHPASIAPDRGYLVVTACRGVDRRGPGDVVLDVEPGDELRWFLSSGSNNFEHMALLQGLRPSGGDAILGTFTRRLVTRPALVPGPPGQILLPAPLHSFGFLQQPVIGHGSGSYHLVFATYETSEQGKPERIGLFQWAMQLTVTPKRDEP